MRKAARRLAEGDVILDRFPGLCEPVTRVTYNGGFVDVGCPPGWQGFRLRADDIVDVEEPDVDELLAVHQSGTVGALR